MQLQFYFNKNKFYKNYQPQYQPKNEHSKSKLEARFGNEIKTFS